MKQHPIKVLMIDDQKVFGSAAQKILEPYNDITFYFCGDSKEAFSLAQEVHPTVILLDIFMPNVDGFEVLKAFKRDPTLKEIPKIMLSSKEDPAIKAHAFTLGATDYLIKFPNAVEFIARIRYHSNSYIHLLERNEAYKELARSKQTLLDELEEAAQYVKSVLPTPLKGEITTDWIFIPSTDLGGDSFGYHWLDQDHFAIYFLDVCGHGVGAALLSISVINVLRAQSLLNTDFFVPSEVLKGLNSTFPMEKHKNMFFTMWYGVFNKVERNLVYSCGGHPPPLLLTGSSREVAKEYELHTPGAIVGGVPEMNFSNASQNLDSFAELFVFSDGVFELELSNGTMLSYSDYITHIKTLSKENRANIEEIVASSYAIQQGSTSFEDDFSLLKITF